MSTNYILCYFELELFSFSIIKYKKLYRLRSHAKTLNLWSEVTLEVQLKWLLTHNSFYPAINQFEKITNVRVDKCAAIIVRRKNHLGKLKPSGDDWEPKYDTQTVLKGPKFGRWTSTWKRRG